MRHPHHPRSSSFPQLRTSSAPWPSWRGPASWSAPRTSAPSRAEPLRENWPRRWSGPSAAPTSWSATRSAGRSTGKPTRASTPRFCWPCGKIPACRWCSASGRPWRNTRTSCWRASSSSRSPRHSRAFRRGMRKTASWWPTNRCGRSGPERSRPRRRPRPPTRWSERPSRNCTAREWRNRSGSSTGDPSHRIPSRSSWPCPMSTGPWWGAPR
mmetsp:Transcript_4666/g.11300  ORF Transcript_4666/g.11300 Transcript_4666/m.11300 type:complete len:212 (+) Transcript_4666:686-1321(+)